VDAARAAGLVTIGLTGEGGGALARRVEHWIPAPAASTARVQEAHLVIEHLLCEMAEESARKGRA
jgi:D-sedoheptulose 7-phosphate isomerase